MQDTYQSTLQIESKPALQNARNLMNNSQYSEALDLIADDDSADALNLKADIYIALKDYSNAVKCLDDALSVNSDENLLLKKADVLYRWAKVTFFPESNFDRALDLINRALGIVGEGEESLEYWFLKGEILQSQERHIDARRCLLKAENRLEELEILENELEIFEAHQNDTLINVTGVNFYKGLEVFEKGTVLKLVREEENDHDPDAIACCLDGEIVGYVANSEYTLINDVKGASDIKNMIGDGSVCEVIMIFQNEFVIAKVRI